MISDGSFVITIGDKGSVVALHKSGEIRNKIFLEKLTDDIKKELAQLFSKNKSTPIYILLDTIDQSYRKKTYPFIRKYDLVKLINRDLHADGDKSNLKNFLLFDSKKAKQQAAATKHWETIFVSASTSPILNEWLELLLEMPNRLIGIYMLPVESFSLFKLLQPKIRSNSKIKNKKLDLYLVVMQNKVCGIRQTVFCEEGVVFTRIANYDFDDKNFLERYEQDIVSTFEYLKRPFPDLSLKELDIVNIMPSDIIAKLKNTTNIDLNFINYTPYQVAAEVEYASAITQNSSFCDLLISKAFVSNKKILKFSMPKIAMLEKLFYIIRSTYYVNLLLLLMIAAFCVTTIYSYNTLEEEKSLAEIDYNEASQIFTRLKNKALDGEVLSESGEVIEIERILDVGKIHEVLGAVGIDYLQTYSKLKFVKDQGLVLNSFTYNLVNFNDKSPSAQTDFKIVLDGNLKNKSGDIENLFTEFDGLTTELKKNFENKKITYVELPHNMDFAKKYYTYPVQFSIQSGK